MTRHEGRRPANGPGAHRARPAGVCVAGSRLAWEPVVTAGSVPGSEETLRDGRVVVLRPLRGNDVVGVEGLWRRLDAPARHRFTALAHLPPDRPGDVEVRGRPASAPGAGGR